MALIDEINKRIKEEIETDPLSLGYAGCKDDTEIMNLLNSSVQRTVTNVYYDPSPMNRILSGLGGAPNALVSSQEVTDAKKVIA